METEYATTSIISYLFTSIEFHIRSSTKEGILFSTNIVFILFEQIHFNFANASHASRRCQVKDVLLSHLLLKKTVTSLANTEICHFFRPRIFPCNGDPIR